MKAITIRQPWASLITSGAKQYETRSWATKYRGPIAIHAAKETERDIFNVIYGDTARMAILIKNGITPRNIGKLPHGAIIATAELTTIYHIEPRYTHGFDKKDEVIEAVSITTDKTAPDFRAYIVPSPNEIALGHWKPGHYAWELQNVKILPEPIPIKGQQGLWNWEPGKEAAIE